VVNRTADDYNAQFDQVISLLNDDASKIKRAAIRVIGTNKLSRATDQLKEMFAQSSGTVKKEVINALVALQPEDLSDIMAEALEDKSRSVRVAALEGTMQANLSDDIKLGLLTSVIQDQTITEKQAAINALAQLPLSLTRQTFENLLTNISDEELPPELRLDVTETITSVNDEALNQQLSLVQAIDDGDIMAAYKDCLTGGDSGNGSQILWRHNGAQCIRCHVVNDYGGIVGPELTHIAEELSAEELLASLVHPSARIAPGYGAVSMFMNDDSEVDGVLLEEDDEKITIRTPENQVRVIDKSEIAERVDGVSAMPTMANVLTKL